MLSFSVFRMWWFVDLISIILDIVMWQYAVIFCIQDVVVCTFNLYHSRYSDVLICCHFLSSGCGGL